MSSDQNKHRRSDRYESLIEFLDNQENGPSAAADGGSDSNVARRGLVDVTNAGEKTAERLTGKAEKTLKSEVGGCVDSQTSSAKLSPAIQLRSSSKPKRYIWEDWDVQDLKLDDEVKKEEVEEKEELGMATGESQHEKMTAARTTLLDLKAASQEIQIRAAKLRAEQEKLKAEVEHLHSVRIENEANHVKEMRRMKKKLKERLAEIEAKYKQMTSLQKKVQSELLAACEKLEKKEARMVIDIEKVGASKNETIERLQSEGASDLKQANKMWDQAEENDLKRREQKLSAKLKKDAAKKIEPRLRALMETNAEELARHQRQAAREIDSYRLELFSKMNRQFKVECDNIRMHERQRAEKLESEWTAKLEEVRSRHCSEMDKVTKDHERRMQLQKKQHDIDMQRITDEHEVAIEDAQRVFSSRMEQITMQYERDLISMENKHTDEVNNRRTQHKLELEKWKVIREKELHQAEEDELKRAETEMRQKIHADLDLVAKKLNEEVRHKRLLLASEADEKIQSIKAAHRKEIDRIQSELDRAEASVSALTSREQEATAELTDLRQKIAATKKSLHEKEDKILLQERAFQSCITECERDVADEKRESERKLSMAHSQLQAVEKELDELIASHPLRIEQKKQELQSLNNQHGDEIQLAQEKIAQMLDRKRAAIEDASTRLSALQKDIAEIDRQTDLARSKLIMDGHPSK